MFDLLFIMHVLSFPHNHRFPVIITDDYSSLHYSMHYGPSNYEILILRIWWDKIARTVGDGCPRPLGGTTSFNIKKHAFVFGQNMVLMNSNVLIESNSIVHKREIYNQRSRTKKVFSRKRNDDLPLSCILLSCILLSCLQIINQMSHHLDLTWLKSWFLILFCALINYIIYKSFSSTTKWTISSSD